MRLKITLKNAYLHLLPFSYKYYLQGFIYSCLGESLATEMHDASANYKKRIYKPFTFSNMIGRYEIVHDSILFKDVCSFVVSSLHPVFLENIQSFLKNTSSIMINGKEFTVEKVIKQKDYLIDGVLAYNTLSSITVYSTQGGKTIFYHPTDKEFGFIIKESLKRKYYAFYGKEFEGFIHIYLFSNIKRSVEKYKDMTYESYRCTLKINTCKEMHELIQNTGLGSKNTAGFGMVEVVRKVL